MRQSHLHNLLAEGLSDSVTVGGKEFKVRTDFRFWIAFEELAQSSDIKPADKAERMMSLCFAERVPVCREAFKALLTFYRCGREGQEGGRRAERRPPVLSYSSDGDYIIAAFQKEYGIDLTRDSVHWWRFCALLKGIGRECRLSEIMMYRAADLSQIKDKRQRAFYKKMKALYALPDTRTEREKEEYIACQIEGLF